MQETQVQSLGREDTLVEKPTPEFLPGKSHEQKTLGDYSPRANEELDTIEHTCMQSFIGFLIL